jgi:protein-L-isoaspartate(D-aspartate) O-methyltransferase
MDKRSVKEAMQVVDRRRFLPRRLRGFAVEDRPLPIGGGQTNSQPQTVRNMLELLDVQPNQRILDVGSGSGWTAALLGYLVGPEGRVIGVEIDPRLATWGAENVAGQDMHWVTIHEAKEGVLGWPDEAPYDRILVSANASETPAELVDQLADDAVMVLPVRSEMLRLTNSGGGRSAVTRHGGYVFVPLRQQPDEPTIRWGRRRHT